MEIQLKAHRLARSTIVEMKNSFDPQMKEQAGVIVQLKKYYNAGDHKEDSSKKRGASGNQWHWQCKGEQVWGSHPGNNRMSTTTLRNPAQPAQRAAIRPKGEGTLSRSPVEVLRMKTTSWTTHEDQRRELRDYQKRHVYLKGRFPSNVKWL